MEFSGASLVVLLASGKILQTWLQKQVTNTQVKPQVVFLTEGSFQLIEAGIDTLLDENSSYQQEIKDHPSDQDLIEKLRHKIAKNEAAITQLQQQLSNTNEH